MCSCNMTFKFLVKFKIYPLNITYNVKLKTFTSSKAYLFFIRSNQQNIISTSEKN